MLGYKMNPISYNIHGYKLNDDVRRNALFPAIVGLITKKHPIIWFAGLAIQQLISSFIQFI